MNLFSFSLLQNKTQKKFAELCFIQVGKAEFSYILREHLQHLETENRNSVASICQEYSSFHKIELVVYGTWRLIRRKTTHHVFIQLNDGLLAHETLPN